MRSRTLFELALLPSLFMTVCSQYYAGNQYYFYQQQYPQYWPQRSYSVQTQNVRYVPQNYKQPPQAVVPPLQRQQQQQPQQQQQQQQQQRQRAQQVPEKIPGQQNKVAPTSAFKFDLPPAPPSRFLSDDDRAKMLSLTKHGRPEHSGTVSIASQQQIQITASSSNITRSQNQPPQIQVHHLQLPPRVLQKTIAPMPSQFTHVISNGTFVPAISSATTQSFIMTQPTKITALAITFSTPTPVIVHHFEAEPVTATTNAVLHVSTIRARNKRVNPNKIFLQCCLNKRVAKSCESKCNFDNINKKTLTAMFLGSDPCPQSYGLDLFACAAQESDHTTCCQVKNVQRTSAGAKCLAFCNLTPESNFQADASYLPCWAVLNDVKNCFKEAIVKGGPM